MAVNKRKFSADPTTGFGTNSNDAGGRFYRKDGSVNVERRGIHFLSTFSWYNTMVSISRWKFWTVLFSFYIVINLAFACLYLLVGIEHLGGIVPGSPLKNFTEAFFFSVQTYTTVGYGRISPVGFLTSSIAAFEAFSGVLTFALASGLFYGRFSRPRSYLKFSNNALIAPYKDGLALMFRTVPYKDHTLTDAEVKITLAIKEKIDGVIKNQFYPLEVEFPKVNTVVLNWTVVHPINEESPIHGLSLQSLKDARAEILVFLKAYDEVFANSVVARTSYTANEIIEGAKFKPMYHPSSSGTSTILNIDQLNAYETVTVTVEQNAVV